MFATGLYIERDPLKLSDLPAGMLSWVQDVGGFAAAGLILWLIYRTVAPGRRGGSGYLPWSVPRRERIRRRAGTAPVHFLSARRDARLPGGRGAATAGLPRKAVGPVRRRGRRHRGGDGQRGDGTLSGAVPEFCRRLRPGGRAHPLCGQLRPAELPPRLGRRPPQRQGGRSRPRPLRLFRPGAGRPVRHLVRPQQTRKSAQHLRQDCLHGHDAAAAGLGRSAGLVQHPQRHQTPDHSHGRHQAGRAFRDRPGPLPRLHDADDGCAAGAHHVEPVLRAPRRQSRCCATSLSRRTCRFMATWTF